jgi:hypothetical protein
MGKGTTALGIIGVILGAGGLGFGLLSWTGNILIQQTMNVWYETDDIVYYPPNGAYAAIPNGSIVISISTPVSLHLLFTGLAGVYPDGVSYTDLFFKFAINGVRLESPWARVGPYIGDEDAVRYSVALQHFIPVVNPGTYNYSVHALAEGSGHYIRDIAFCIRSYPI